MLSWNKYMSSFDVRIKCKYLTGAWSTGRGNLQVVGFVLKRHNEQISPFNTFHVMTRTL